MSAGKKVKKVLKFVFLVWCAVVLIGIGLKAIGGFMADGTLDTKTVLGLEDNWYGFAVMSPADITSAGSSVNIKLDAFSSVTFGPLPSLEDCEKTAISILPSMYDPENASYICGLDCKENGDDKNFTCKRIERGAFSSYSSTGEEAPPDIPE